MTIRALLVSVLVLGSFAGATFASAVEPVAHPNGEVSPAPLMATEEKLDGKAIRNIRRDFRKKLDLERAQLKKESKELRKKREAERKLRRKEWDKTENEARRKYFDENRHGPERRAYVIELQKRRKDFYSSLKAEDRQDKVEREARWKALEEDQKNRWKMVEESLKRGVRPDSQLLQTGS